MKSSVYQISGCAGSRVLREVASGFPARGARTIANEFNHQNADALGLSWRDYRERSEGGEGWHISARTGMDGGKIE